MFELLFVKKPIDDPLPFTQNLTQFLLLYTILPYTHSANIEVTTHDCKSTEFRIPLNEEQSFRSYIEYQMRRERNL